MTMSVWGIFLRSTITVARIYVDAAEAAEGRPRRHKEEEEESHRGHPRPYKLGAGVHLQRIKKSLTANHINREVEDGQDRSSAITQDLQGIILGAKLGPWWVW